MQEKLENTISQRGKLKKLSRVGLNIQKHRTIDNNGTLEIISQHCIVSHDRFIKIRMKLCIGLLVLHFHIPTPLHSIYGVRTLKAYFVHNKLGIFLQECPFKQLIFQSVAFLVGTALT